MPSSDTTAKKVILFSVHSFKQAYIGLGNCYVMLMKEANGTFLIYNASIFVPFYDLMYAFKMKLACKFSMEKTFM